MTSNKPLTYLCSRTVLQYLSFSRRKQFYLTCPAIRKTEESVPHRLESVRAHSTSKNLTVIAIDDFEFRFWKLIDSTQLVVQNSTKLETLVSQTVFEQEADDKFLLYYFNREGTVIKNLEGECRWILECKLKAIKNLVTRMSQETVNMGILLNLNCYSISVDSRMTPTEFLDYCRSLATRTDRPIGSVFKMNIGLFSITRNAYFDLVHSQMNANITLLDGEKYATIPMDESKELIIYCDNKALVVEVYASGTRAEQTTDHSERRARRVEQFPYYPHLPILYNPYERFWA
ncbi:hypothetical protein GCK72_021068 [Caenorhabditis remanei]|uniref:F-box associated domain-containing protein n=1 Tax=Caenorhabditis remanei TaxID=31234 RepID=A0A6A5GIV9_CAERE|nr:hypothetical protein GCK72_021068 [Caenorhabditis remanei]KAF1754505.1 hypothetical protein GCK72_021068 [Caenorhabditis remanei]